MKTLEERFWSKVKKGPGCWEWTGSKDRKGYGGIHVRPKGMKAHRVSWMLAHGEHSIPTGKMILHHCDNPPCVRPDHLYVGDAKANMDDTVKRGHHRFASMKHCKRGHPLAGSNVLRKRSNPSWRPCGKCDKILAARRWQREVARRNSREGKS